MDAWIRSGKAWAHLAMLQVLKYDVPVWSSGSDAGTVTVAGETSDYTGDWLILAGHLFVVKSCAPGKGSTQISVQLPDAAFSRQLRYSGTGSEIFGAFIAAKLASEYVGQSDAEYAMPYLNVSNSDTTAFSFPVEPGEIYTLRDVILLAQEAGVYMTWTTAYNGLSVSIAKRTPASHTVFFDDGHTQLKGQTYTNSVVAKATVRRIRTMDDVTEVLATGTYYWHADGSVSSTPPSPRIPGNWVLADVGEEEALIDGATAAMANNTQAYKVEFYSDKALQLGDKLTMQINGILSRGTLSCARISSGDRRTLYRCGTAAVTLTDKISAKGTSGSRGKSSKNSGSVELTYVTNSLVTSSNFTHALAYRVGRLVILELNLDLASGATSDYVKIGTMPFTAVQPQMVTAVVQEATPSAMATYRVAGNEILVYKPSTGGGTFRATIPIFVS